MDKYANVIVDVSQEQLDRTFQYKIPVQLEEKIVPGVTVLVPFGNGNRLINAFVLEVTDTPAFDVEKTKEIKEVYPERVEVENRLIELAVWIKDNFGSTLNQALKTVMPVKIKITHKKKKTIRLIADAKTVDELSSNAKKHNHYAKYRLLQALLEDDIIEYGLVTGKLNVSAQTVKGLEKKGIIAVDEVEYYRNPVKAGNVAENNFCYTPEQRNAIDTFCHDYDSGLKKTYLLHGITGSGKTEVYMAMIEKVIKEKKQAIVMIPEIALTYQTVTRFYRRFVDRVSIINSRLSNGERYDQYCRAKNGEIDIMIGPRSSLFTPFKNIGLIIIDEEHDSAYKSETSPRYHAKMVAQHIALQHGASLVLGSATPSVTTYYEAETGRIKLLELRERAAGGHLADAEIVDMREELKDGNRSILSRKLKTLIDDRLSKKQQTILFLNKRGYTGFISCRSCGEVIKCPHCDISLTYHSRGKNRGKMVCHFCGYETEAVRICPSCGSSYLSGFKAGTQQIEESVQKLFPNAKILRMDADTTSGKDGHEKILSSFAAGEADILVGTQMIVKGHDFENVTLVGILAADMSLYAAGYGAAERTFQLLTQAAGRAGRGKLCGEVVIQTYSPTHYAVVNAANQDYNAFYEQEIGYRKLSGYPPFNNILMITFSSEDEDALEKGVSLIRPMREELTVIGPVDAPVYKSKDVYHKIMYIKAKEYETLTVFAAELDNYIKKHAKFRKIEVQYDFNPMD